MPPEPGGRLCCRNPRCIQTPCCCSSSRGKAWIRRGKQRQQQQARRFPRKSGTLAHPDTVPRRKRSMLEGVRVRVAILSRSSCLFSPPLPLKHLPSSRKPKRQTYQGSPTLLIHLSAAPDNFRGVRRWPMIQKVPTFLRPQNILRPTSFHKALESLSQIGNLNRLGFPLCLSINPLKAKTGKGFTNQEGRNSWS